MSVEQEGHDQCLSGHHVHRPTEEVGPHEPWENLWTLLSRVSWCMYRDRQTKILCSIQNRNVRKPCRPLWTESKSERQWFSQQSASASFPAPRTAIPPGVVVRHATADNGTDDGGDDYRGPAEGPREEVTPALQRGHRVIPQTKQEDHIPALLHRRGPQRTQVAGFRVNGSCVKKRKRSLFLYTLALYVFVIYIIMYSVCTRVYKVNWYLYGKENGTGFEVKKIIRFVCIFRQDNRITRSVEITLNINF